MLTPRTRQRLDPLLRRASGGRLYYEYTLRGELVGRYEGSREAALSALSEAGYERPPTIGPIPLEAAKTRPESDRPHDLSLRRVDPTDERRQYHVHGWVANGGVELHSHLEYRPDMRPVGGESLRAAYARLREHLSPSWGPRWGDGTTYVPGRHDRTLEQLLA